MSNNFKHMLIGLSLAMVTTTATAAEVAWNLEEYNGKATVFFGKVTGTYDLNNFTNGGSMSIKVVIEGNGNKYTHNATVRVSKKDTYIEPTRGAHISELTASMEKYNQQFGAFANVNCTLIE